MNWIYNKVCFISFLYLIPFCFDYVTPNVTFDINEQGFDNSCIHNLIVETYYKKRKYWLTSNLGSILFKNQPTELYYELDTIFNVLIWNHAYWLREYIDDPLTVCDVQNCMFTTNRDFLETSDVIVVGPNVTQFPSVHKRNLSQIWVFLSNESPIHIFGQKIETVNYSRSIASMANIFNWSMTYRSDADVPIPYGRTIPISETMMRQMSSQPITKFIPYWEEKQTDVLLVAVISHCNVPERMNYLYELQKYIKLDLLGRCATTEELKESCPGHSLADCPAINKYIFYLAFENSRCRQYITEKVFYNAFVKGAIPVVMGAPISDYEKLLPPHSFLHVNSFNSPKDLASEILKLSANYDNLLMYHNWRYYFKIHNEHSYFGSKSHELCRLCQALNFNDYETKVYDVDTLKLYLDPKLLCTKPVKPTIRPRTTVKPRVACRRRIVKP